MDNIYPYSVMEQGLQLVSFSIPFSQLFPTPTHPTTAHILTVLYPETAVGDLGLATELGNYAEYSGAPNTAETYAYAKTLLDCATANPDGRKRALLVGGGIANFTDVAATFKGIISV